MTQFRTDLHRKYILLAFLAIPVFFAGCRNDDIVKDEDKFAAVYVDLVIINEQYRSDSVLISSKVDSVYRKHGITEESYQSTIKYYQDNPERWKEFFNKAEAYLKEKRKSKAQ